MSTFTGISVYGSLQGVQLSVDSPGPASVHSNSRKEHILVSLIGKSSLSAKLRFFSLEAGVVGAGIMGLYFGLVKVLFELLPWFAIRGQHRGFWCGGSD